jgi:membrane associated rhomboid family serine protease
VIPIKDNIPRIRLPIVVFTLMALNLLVFLFELGLPQEDLAVLFHLQGVVPARFTDPTWASVTGYPPGGWSAIFTYMFLHGGWLHIILNMWVLWIFADNVEDALGHWRFLAFYLTCGLLAVGLHVFFNPDSTMPVIGASGAIAGVMGAYFRLFPLARIMVLIPLLFIPWIVEIPALVFLGIWFFLQVLSGLMPNSPHETSQGVAWWAHVGGFVCGMLLVRLFGPLDCRYCYVPETRNYERR